MQAALTSRVSLARAPVRVSKTQQVGGGNPAMRHGGACTPCLALQW